MTPFLAAHLLVARFADGRRTHWWSCSSRQGACRDVLGFSRNVRVRLPGPPTSPPSVISVQHCRRRQQGKGWTVHAGHRLMGGAAQQAGQHYRQRPRGGQPRHRACAYRARPSCTHLVRHALAHKMLAHVGVRVSGVRRKPCTERLISFRSIHCAALVSRF